jgi:hypothetical protein
LGTIVSAVAEVEHKGRGIASSFLSSINNRQVLVSAWHCFAEDPSQSAGRSPLVNKTVKFPNDLRVSVDVGLRYPTPAEKDLVILPLTEEIDVTPIQISEAPVGDILSGSRRIACVGYPLDSYPVVSYGRIEDANVGRGDFTFDALVGPGSSGGVVINERGQGIGLVYGIFGLGYAYFLTQSGRVSV